MEKKAPTVLGLLVIAGFVLSCFGLALFLWISFGGPTPLGPEPEPTPCSFSCSWTMFTATLWRA